MTLFDAIVMVDWSACSRPKRGKDSIWIGVARRRGRQLRLEDPLNTPTRREAEAYVAQLLKGLVSEGARTLVGFDFPYGYPRGFASALGLPRELPAWRAVWDHLSHVPEGDRNENDRFGFASGLNARVGRSPGPFWGCPPKRETSFLQSRRKGRWDFPYQLSGGGELARLRVTDARMKGVQETWKLLGAGSVGSQALLGIPCVARLRDRPDLAACSRVWPFETGFTANPLPDVGPFVLHAEIWPGAVELDEGLHPVRDAAQVLTLARRLAEIDAQEGLGDWFAEPADLAPGVRDACLAEEGWILGGRTSRG